MSFQCERLGWEGKRIYYYAVEKRNVKPENEEKKASTKKKLCQTIKMSGETPEIGIKFSFEKWQRTKKKLHHHQQRTHVYILILDECETLNVKCEIERMKMLAKTLLHQQIPGSS